MRKMSGFTLIELVLFIIILSILAKTILLALYIGTTKAPATHQNIIARQAAIKCMEWFVGQRRLNGYTSLTCPDTITPSFCTVPNGFTINVNTSCTTINTDANYKTITVTVSGLGDATLSTLIAA